MTSEALASQARSLYRALLRELPPRPLSSPSPLKLRLRSQFRSAPSPSNGEHARDLIHCRLQETEQFVQYARAQRTYVTLLERYNPGVNMDQEEKVRLTARRVGMDLPILTDGGYDNTGNDRQ